jgi:hypothetical protein
MLEFWAVAANALQLATFISLHRIFDGDSSGNVYALLAFAEKHLRIFSRRALEVRRGPRQGGSLDSAHEGTADDFLQLKREVGRRRTTYDDKYGPIRGKILAHQVLDGGQAQERYAATLIVELHELCTFFPALHDALWGLYMNGIRPDVNCPPSP